MAEHDTEDNVTIEFNPSDADSSLGDKISTASTSGSSLLAVKNLAVKDNVAFFMTK